MTLLAVEIGHEETLRTFRMAFAGRQLPSSRARDAFVFSRSAARHTTEETLFASAVFVVIATTLKKYERRLIKCRLVGS